MIGRIKGVIVEKHPTNQLLVDVGGVGYEISVPTNTFDDSLIDQDTLLYTYDHVRESSRDLYGFADRPAKDLFELLLTVSGVGPRGALAIMSLGDASQIRKAIAGGNVSFVSGASGVGKRIAERVTVDLKDKVGVVAGHDVGFVDSGDDALDALTSLGYSSSQAGQVLGTIDRSLSTEDRIRAALKELG